MPLTRCTLTGIEASVPLGSIAQLLTDYPFLELGVLYRPKAQGQGRYPTAKWIAALLRHLGPAARDRLALHVCGGAVRQVVDGVGNARPITVTDIPDGPLAVTEADLAGLSSIYPREWLVTMGHLGLLLPHFGRIQLNFKREQLAFEDRDIPRVASILRGTTIITQHQGCDPRLTREMAGMGNHAMLYDASGGRGIAPESWSAPLPGIDCGYAGGLGPDTIADELPRITAAAGGADFWLDMESRIRSPDDCFSLVLARRLLDRVAPHVGA